MTPGWTLQLVRGALSRFLSLLLPFFFWSSVSLPPSLGSTSPDGFRERLCDEGRGGGWEKVPTVVANVGEALVDRSTTK